MHTLGTCGLCAGPVKVPEAWPAFIQPVPKCDRCGSEAALPHGPLMQMRRPDAQAHQQQGAFSPQQVAQLRAMLSELAGEKKSND